MNKTIYWVLGVIILLVIVIFIFNQRSTTGLFSFSNKLEYITIGAVLPLTGSNSNLGIPEQEGILLAVENINQSKVLGKTKLRVIFEDSKADPKEGVLAVNKLLTIDDADFIISSLTNVTDAIAPIVMDRNKTLYYFSTDSRIAKENKFAFKDYFDHAISCSLAAKFAKEQKITSVGFLSLDRSSGKLCFDSFKEEFTKDYDGVIYNESYPSTETDYKSYITRLKEKNIEMVFINDYSAKIPSIIVQTYPIYTPEYYFILMGAEPVANTELTKLIYSKTNTFGVYPIINKSNNIATTKFIFDYNKKYYSLPTHDAIYGYDSINALIESYKNCDFKTEATCIANKL